MLPNPISFISCLFFLSFFLLHSRATFTKARSSCVPDDDSNTTTTAPCFQHQSLLSHLSPFSAHRFLPPNREWPGQGGGLFNRRVPDVNYLNENEDTNRLHMGGYNYPHGYSGPQPEYNGGYPRTLVPAPIRAWNPFYFRPMSPPPAPSWSPFSRPSSPHFPPSYPDMRPNNFFSGLFSKRTTVPIAPSVTEEKSDPVYLGPGNLKILSPRLAEITCSFDGSRIVSVSCRCMHLLTFRLAA